MEEGRERPSEGSIPPPLDVDIRSSGRMSHLRAMAEDVPTIFI